MEDTKFILSAKVMPVDLNAALLVIRRSASDSSRPGDWEFAGGEFETNESSLQAAARETFEETGLTIAKNQLFEIPGNPREKKSAAFDHWHQRYFYVGHLLVSRPEVTLSTEHDYFIWLSAEEILAERIVVDDQLVKIGHPEQKRALEDAYNRGMFSNFRTKA